MPNIFLDNVSVTYGELPVLDSITLSLQEHRIGIIGANGGGKSTLVRLINGLSDPSSGTVIVDGLDVATHGKSVRRKVGFVFSDAENQIIMPTVKDDIAFSLRRLALDKETRRKRIAAVLARFGLESHAEHSPHLLSSGQKQLLALASVLVIEPEILIMDEPTTLLDLRNRAHIKNIIEGLDQQVIAVTHDLDLLSNFDRVLCVHDRKILFDGPPESVISQYVSLMENNPL
ncbi:energy-coupling factor ABC transporter ATP-binding protein [Corynebacterium pseudotuberculosis]|uniref:ATP-binding cassette domain-containing protein n=2 Tax=Corynebacterium pseudotuberculosis TaxID=1719 RepID=D9QAZ7_CORP2|nr:ABC transporter ATP-binding protein [Corynebacterium pseudotuberculosis]AER69297.1 Cobalt import ATP-binding protein CbiO [Corynebacterium pseudotuberculosis 1/06-A]ADK29050.1 ATP-binding cassette domain-containing protein [Corynebacterium pseudotuberculosis FRC41]ADL10723.1 ATP-binding cassette domain-containing protein [Corynebacterium pseudotuberculosis C231]ADL21131.1 ABC transporter ATP-binding protein [Corynebacterium pseudotuberculosis 1002]ADO26523.1 ATP-binding cassette domain-cont